MEQSGSSVRAYSEDEEGEKRPQARGNPKPVCGVREQVHLVRGITSYRLSSRNWAGEPEKWAFV